MRKDIINVFHELCDDKGATITIAKSNHGNIFGGYTSTSCKSNEDEWIKDKKLRWRFNIALYEYISQCLMG